MVRLVECDGCLRPSQIGGLLRRGDHVHFSVDDLQSTLAFNISKNHQSGIDFGITIVFLFILIFVRLFLLLTGLFFLELLACRGGCVLFAGVLGT